MTGWIFTNGKYYADAQEYCAFAYDNNRQIFCPVCRKFNTAGRWPHVAMNKIKTLKCPCGSILELHYK